MGENREAPTDFLFEAKKQAFFVDNLGLFGIFYLLKNKVVLYSYKI